MNGMHIRMLAFVSAGLLLAPVSAMSALPEFAKPGVNEMRAHFIDVGQGSAVLLEFSCGTALIDTGGEKNDKFDSIDRLGRYLNQFFARRADLKKTLDLLLLTHPHIDHTRGVPTVLKLFKVNSLVDDGLESGSGGRQQKAAHQFSKGAGSTMTWTPVTQNEAAKKSGLTSEKISPITCTGTSPQFRPLWGALDRGEWTPTILKNANNSSVVTRLDFGKASFLFPGDLEDDVQGELMADFSDNCRKPNCLLDVDVYHVAHHGSHNGTSADLVKAMTPRMAVISMGPWNRREQWTASAYGHPRRDAINALLQGPGHVSDVRAKAVDVMIANRAGSGKAKSKPSGPQFSKVSMKSAIYGTGWEGTVVITAGADGQLRVNTEH